VIFYLVKENVPRKMYWKCTGGVLGDEHEGKGILGEGRRGEGEHEREGEEGWGGERRGSTTADTAPDLALFILALGDVATNLMVSSSASPMLSMWSNGRE
jgi:hypothetical protein